MAVLRCVVLLITCLVCGCGHPRAGRAPHVAANASQTSDPAALIARLAAMNDGYFDFMHGNAHSDLQELMMARFDATAAITRSIDRYERAGTTPELVKVLYYTLGFVKDPAAIEWLNDRVGIESRSHPFETVWLATWLNRDKLTGDRRRLTDGYGSWAWLEDRDRWIAFFIRAIERSASDERRALLLEILAGFEDPAVVSVFNRVPVGPREILVTEYYWRVHGGGDPNDERMATAIDVLARDRANHKFLLMMAHALRHAAFVPYLIATLDRESERRAHPWNAQETLEKITFDVRFRGREAWQQWFAAHGRAGRQAWLDDALSTMRRFLQEDEQIAEGFFERVRERWDDIALLPFIDQELSSRPAFRDDISLWIDLTDRPAYRSRLEPLARKLNLSDPFSERWWDRRSDDTSWREYVRRLNSIL